MIWLPDRRIVVPKLRKRQGGWVSPFGCGFQKIVSNLNMAVVPGTAITPGINDALGSYTEIISDTNLTEDAYGIWLHISGGSVAAQARPTLMNIGADPAGGTAYADIISDLCAGPCFGSGAGSGWAGFSYYFPLYIKAGTALAARARVGNGTAGSVNVVCKLFCKPTKPELLRVGAYVDSIGADTTNSRGTLITPGVSFAEGAYTTLGTLPRPAWWFQQGYSIDDSTMNGSVIYSDLAHGTAGSEELIIENQKFSASGSEAILGTEYSYPSCMIDLDSGATIRARSTIDIATADANNSVIAYALGG